jgi:hypothetical protein
MVVTGVRRASEIGVAKSVSTGRFDGLAREKCDDLITALWP